MCQREAHGIWGSWGLASAFGSLLPPSLEPDQVWSCWAGERDGMGPALPDPRAETPPRRWGIPCGTDGPGQLKSSTCSLSPRPLPFPRRYLAIRYPLHSRELRTPRNALTAICLIWGLSLVFSGPYLSYYQQFQLANLTVCHPIWDAARRKAMDLCTFVFSYLVPVLILGLTYTRTIRYLWRSVDPLQDASESKAAKRKVTRMIIIVAVLFCLCWLPHHLLILCVWFGYFPLNHATYVLRVLSHLVSYANSCVNPIVYALVSKHFRKGFKKIFSCLLRKRAANKVHAAPATHTASTLEAELSELTHGLPRRCSARCEVPEGSRGEEDAAGGQQQGADGSFVTFNVT